MSDDFDAQLDEALKRERKLLESVQPSSGIWYYVYFKPDWRLEVYRSTDYGFIRHEDAWKNYIVPELAKHYKLTPTQVRDLADAYQGMPRGRVDISAPANELKGICSPCAIHAKIGRASCRERV